MNHSQMYWLHAITPLHVGAGRGAGVIDLPVVREKVTQWPYVPGSSVKGVVSDAHGASIRGSDGDSPRPNEWHAAAFGRPASKTVDADNAGSLVFTDARIVCLPVRSLVGTFAWATCPLVLQRLKQDAGLAGNTALAGLPVPEPEVANAAVTSIDTSKLVHPVQDTFKLYLEDFDLDAVDGDKTKAWAEQLGTSLFGATPEADPERTAFHQRFVIIHNDLFNFLCETALEVRARIKLDPDTKTTVGGALWYEESLPIETILSGTVWCDKVFGDAATRQNITPQTLLKKYCEGTAHFQMGGKASTGKGLVRAIGLAAAGAA